MKRELLLVFIAALVSLRGNAQVQEQSLTPVVDQPIESADIWSFEQLQYALEKVLALPSPSSGIQWTRETDRLRKLVLDKVIFHGWPKQVVDAKPAFEKVGPILVGKGYRIRKLRYEVVPGLWSTALLYEPEEVRG